MFQLKKISHLFFLLAIVLSFVTLQADVITKDSGSRNVLEPTHEIKHSKGKTSRNVLDTNDDDDEPFFANYSNRVIPENSFIFAGAAEDHDEDESSF